MTGVSYGKTVGQMVAERPARARVFERLGIDYCGAGWTWITCRRWASAGIRPEPASDVF